MMKNGFQLFELVVGAALLGLVVWLKTRDLDKVAPTRLRPWTKVAAEIALSYIAIAAVLNPLIPGFPVLTVRVPSAATKLRLLEHLQVRVTPVGLYGVAGGDRVTYASFDNDGSALLVPELTLFETHVNVEIFDITQPTQILKSTTVYISPFVKRQLTNQTITFEKE